MSICVGFTGGNCSGKTTLSNWVISEFGFEYYYINQTRKLINEEYDSNLELARKDSYNFQKKLLNHKIYWERKHKKTGFVSDRTTVDNAAYFLGFTSRLSTPETLRYVEKAMNHAVKTYDIIFCLSPLFDVQKDLLSPSDACIQLRIYYTVRGLLDEFISHVENLYKRPIIVYIEDSDMDKRQEIINTYLNNL
jgi:hypothetical protein